MIGKSPQLDCWLSLGARTIRHPRSKRLHLAQYPQLQRRLRDDKALIPAAIEKYLRLYTPSGLRANGKGRHRHRRALDQEGRAHRAVYASANRDEALFENSDDFIRDRPKLEDHVEFGMGPHRCAGESLAQLTLRVTLEEFLKRTHSFEHNGGIRMTRRPEWGPLSVPVKIRPLPRLRGRVGVGAQK